MSKLDKLKNPIFIANSTDPLTGKFVKSIWLYFKYDHGKRESYKLVWQYYRDRGRTSIETFYKHHKGHRIRMIFSGDPVQYEMEILLIKDVIKVVSIKNKLPILNINNDNNIYNNNDVIVSNSADDICTSETIIMKTPPFDENKIVGRIERQIDDPIIFDIMARPLNCDFDMDEMSVFGKQIIENDIA